MNMQITLMHKRLQFTSLPNSENWFEKDQYQGTFSDEKYRVPCRLEKKIIVSNRLTARTQQA